MRHNIILLHLAAVALLTGCASSGSKNWGRLSAAVDAFAAQHGGRVLPGLRPPATAEPPGCKRWMIVVPVDKLDHSTLNTYSRALASAVSCRQAHPFPAAAGAHTIHASQSSTRAH